MISWLSGDVLSIYFIMILEVCFINGFDHFSDWLREQIHLVWDSYYFYYCCSLSRFCLHGQNIFVYYYWLREQILLIWDLYYFDYCCSFSRFCLHGQDLFAYYLWYFVYFSLVFLCTLQTSSRALCAVRHDGAVLVFRVFRIFRNFCNFWLSVFSVFGQSISVVFFTGILSRRCHCSDNNCNKDHYSLVDLNSITLFGLSSFSPFLQAFEPGTWNW